MRKRHFGRDWRMHNKLLYFDSDGYVPLTSQCFGRFAAPRQREQSRRCLLFHIRGRIPIVLTNEM